jgi:hypothetical protein
MCAGPHLQSVGLAESPAQLEAEDRDATVPVRRELAHGSVEPVLDGGEDTGLGHHVVADLAGVV